MLISRRDKTCDQAPEVKAVAILGSTGSIGVNTLKVIANHPERFRVVSLVSGGRGELLIEQARRFQPEVVAIYQVERAAEVKDALADTSIQVLSGKEGVIAAATWASASMVVSAIVGAAGLEPTLAAIQAGKDIALANKECLVMAGALFMEEVAHRGIRLIPVDSEHSAIFQVLFNGRTEAGQGGPFFSVEQAFDKAEVQSLVLTASGGPFRGWSCETLEGVTPEMALAHPRWRMGRKISIDSATMMNKGLEVIEAFHLFGIAVEQIQVVVHPESIVHSMVSYRDGSVLAQLGVPDMRTPIAVALAWPERVATAVPALDLTQVGRLNFFPAPNALDFPCLTLAYHAIRQGGLATVVLNAANEVAVAAFLEGKMGFLDIPRLIEWAMEHVSSALSPGDPSGTTGTCTIEAILQVDDETRRKSEAWIVRRGSFANF